jgi:hypothetical protein
MRFFERNFNAIGEIVLAVIRNMSFYEAVSSSTSSNSML